MLRPERTLRFIRSAQRYGFSLNDIKLIVGADKTSKNHGADIINIAEQRFLDIERRVTEMLVLRHELELFMDDLTTQVDSSVAILGDGRVGLILDANGLVRHARGRESVAAVYRSAS